MNLSLLTLWGKRVTYLSSHVFAGFAITYHFLIDGGLFKYLAVELFGLVVSLLAFWGLLNINAGITLDDFGGDVNVYVATLDSAYTTLPVSQQSVFLQHFEQELLESEGILSTKELDRLWEWFYSSYPTVVEWGHGSSPFVSMEQSVMDVGLSPVGDFEYLSEEQEQYSVSSYLHVLHQLGILDA